MEDTFIGRFVLISKENFNEFMKGIGVAPEWIELSKHSKLITEISKESSNNYVVKRTGHRKTVSNKLMLGKPCLVETIKGEKVRLITQVEGNKVVARGDFYVVTMEMVDNDHLKETIIYNNHEMSRISRRMKY